MFGSDTFDADIARSMALAEAAIALDPNLPGAYNLIAMGLHVLGRTEEALSNANYAVGIGPNNGQAMVPAAAVHLYAGRYERAAALLQHAERLTPVPDVILLLVRAMNFNALGDYPAAEAYARRVIAILPAQNNIGHRELLFALVQSGQMDEATKLANHLLAVDPEFSTASVRRRFELCCRSPAALVDEYVKALSEAGIP